MIRGAGNVGLLKRERLTDTRATLFGLPILTSDEAPPGTVEFRGPAQDRVQDGRHLLHQDDADHAPPYDAIRISGGPLVSAIIARELIADGTLRRVRDHQERA